MPLIDDLNVPLPDEELERRRFLGLLGSGALALAGVGTALAGARYLEPDVLYEPDGRLAVCRPEAISMDAIHVQAARRVYLVHDRRGFYALSAVCTHLGCVTRHDPSSNHIVCPCHGSVFDCAGNVIRGPAREPLHHLCVTLERGVLVVDVNARVSPDTVLEV